MNTCKICGDSCPDKYDTCWIHRHSAALSEHVKRLDNNPRDKPKASCGTDFCEVDIDDTRKE